MFQALSPLVMGGELCEAACRLGRSLWLQPYMNAGAKLTSFGSSARCSEKASSVQDTQKLTGWDLRRQSKHNGIIVFSFLKHLWGWHHFQKMSPLGKERALELHPPMNQSLDIWYYWMAGIMCHFWTNSRRHWQLVHTPDHTLSPWVHRCGLRDALK